LVEGANPLIFDEGRFQLETENRDKRKEAGQMNARPLLLLRE
jgi:hypothetical protein